MFLASQMLVILVATATPAVAPDPATMQFEEITKNVSAYGRARARTLMDQWVRTHPQSPQAGRGLVWIAELYIADGQRDLAIPYFARAAKEYPGTEWASHGIRGMAEYDLAHRRYSAALAGYRTLAANPTPLWNYIGRTGIAQTESERFRFILFVITTLVLFALLCARFWIAKRAGVRVVTPPEECIYLLPIFVLMILAALRQPRDEGEAVIIVAVGGFLLVWANVVYLRARPPRRWSTRVREGVLGILQPAALLYCAVIGSNVWLKFHDTLVMGGAAE